MGMTHDFSLITMYICEILFVTFTQRSVMLDTYLIASDLHSNQWQVTYTVR